MKSELQNAGKLIILTSGSADVSYTVKYHYNGQPQDDLTVWIPAGQVSGTKPINAPIDNVEVYLDGALVARYPNGSLDHDNSSWGHHYMLKADNSQSSFWISWNPSGNAVVIMDDKITMVD